MKTAGCAACVLLLAAAAGLPADNWPSWRGNGTGQSAAKAPPLKWNKTENIRWKAELPEAGNSSPVVWGQRVFLTQAMEKGKRRAVLCFDRANGKLLWQRETKFDGKEPTHETNPYCSATPVTDGQRVIASLGSAGMVCYDFSGKELWRKDVGKMEHIWGNGSSPILFGDLAILWCGPGERQVLLAVKKTNGEKVWSHDEPGGQSGLKSGFGDWRGSFSTPLVARVGDHDELILCVPEKVKGFDPKTGKELWSCSGMGKLVYTTPLCSADGTVVAFSGFYGPALAAPAGGKGDVTEKRLWHHKGRNPQRIGSPVLVGEHVYQVNDLGNAQCMELKTGKDLWEKKRVGSAWGSMVHAAGRLYVCNNAGDTLVFAASPKYELLARNSLGEQVRSSPAVVDDEIFIRTYKHLWCIGAKKP